MNGVAGAVLAGGASRRMGADKALIPVDGVPLAVRTAQTLRAAGCGPVWLVGSQPALHNLDWPSLPDAPGAGHHPLRGVVAALRASTQPLVLICPCDLPALTADAVRRLLDHGGPCVAHSGDRRHHLLAVLPVTLLQRAQQIMDQQGPARLLVADLPAVTLDPQTTANANTPADLLAHGRRS